MNKNEIKEWLLDSEKDQEIMKKIGEVLFDLRDGLSDSMTSEPEPTAKDFLRAVADSCNAAADEMLEDDIEFWLFG